MQITLLQKYQLITFILIWMSYGATYFLRKPLGVIKTDLEEEFRFPKAQLGWLDTAMLLPYAAVQMLLGPLSDKVSPKKMLSLCLFLCGANMLTFGLWNNFYMFAFILILNGTFQAPCWPACCKSLSAWYPDSSLNTVFGVVCTAAFGGGIGGTALAVYLQSAYGWRIVHVPPSIVIICISVMTYCILKTPEEKGISVPNKEFSPDKEKSAQLEWLALWQIPMVAEIATSVFCLKLVRYCMYLWLPMYFMQYLNYSKPQAGIFSTFFDVGGVIGSPMMGIILDRLCKGQPLFGITMMMCIGSVSFILFTVTASWGVVYNSLFMFIAGACNCAPDALLAGAVTMTIGEMGGRNAGAAVTGLVNGFGSFGAIIEGPVVGFVSQYYGWNGMFFLMILISIVGTATAFRAYLIERLREKAGRKHMIETVKIDA